MGALRRQTRRLAPDWSRASAGARKSSRDLRQALAPAPASCVPRPAQALALGFLVCETSDGPDGLEGAHLDSSLRPAGRHSSNPPDSLRFTLPLCEPPMKGRAAAN